MRGGTPGHKKRQKRTISFSDNLERVHFFDPTQSFKPGRNAGGSVDFRINLSKTKAAAEKMRLTVVQAAKQKQELD